MNVVNLIATRTCLLLFLMCSNTQAISHEMKVDWSVNGKPNLIDESVERQLDQLLSNMTLEQKVAQMIQPEIGYLSVEQMRKYGFGSYLNGGNTAPYGEKQADQRLWLKFADEMYEASVDATLDGSVIPTIWGTDAMHGHSNVFGATLFPHNIGLGAARNPDLIEEIGIATAKEVAATGIEWSFAPTVAVVRDDRWGRTYESYSEDPEIVADYAGRMVQGIQGNPTEDFLSGYHRIATAKHFIGDGGTTSGIDRGDTQVDEQTLRDIHGAGYFSALRAGVQSVMASFNSWNGERVHGHKYLLTDVLKKKMGFEGFVVSDWNAHKFVDGCDLEQCAAAINAGVDVLMVPEHFEAFFHNTVQQVKEGIISESRIDDAVRRFLRAKIRWGVFSRGKPSKRLGAQNTNWLNAPSHKALAQEAVRKSLVLLKNNGNTLPINPRNKVLVAGDGAHNIAMQAGGWSVSWQGTDNDNHDFPNATSIYEGLKQRIELAGGSITLNNDGLFEEKPDVAIVVIGEQPYAEWFGDIQTLEFDHNNKNTELLKRLKAQGIPTVTVFLSGRPLWVNRILNVSDAFVAAWLPGSEGQGIADVILSKANGEINHDFSGKLSFSWPKYDNQYQLNRNDSEYDPLFAYGYGLTYQDDFELIRVDEVVSARPSQKNTNVQPLFVRNLSKGLQWSLSDPHKGKVLVDTPYGVSPDGQSLTMQSINLAFQEDGRKFSWSNASAPTSAELVYNSIYEKDENFDVRFVNMKVRIDKWSQSSPITFQVQCGDNSCQNTLIFNNDKYGLVRGKWIGLSIETGCFDTNAQHKNINTPLRISSKGNASLAVAEVTVSRTSTEGHNVASCQTN